MKIELIVDNYEDRKNLFLALARSGYSVWGREEYAGFGDTKHFVVFETEKPKP